MMKPGLENRRNVPHHAAAVLTAGLTEEALKILKESRSTNGCTGGWSTERIGEWSDKSASVPCMTECAARRSELVRNADSPSTESVSGR